MPMATEVGELGGAGDNFSDGHFRSRSSRATVVKQAAVSLAARAPGTPVVSHRAAIKHEGYLSAVDGASLERKTAGTNETKKEKAAKVLGENRTPARPTVRKSSARPPTQLSLVATARR
ncbi:hypothetical protein MRX96_034739 [Rhipicephalus microplus]